MKSYTLTLFVVIGLFATIMGVVALKAFARQSNSTGIDPAQIARVRDRAD